MADISIKAAIGQLLGVLDEAFEHPQKPWIYFTDHGADAGFFGAIRQKMVFNQKS